MTALAAAVRARWFPAEVLLPGRTQAWPRCYTLATDHELCVFTKVSDDPEWHSLIHWGSTVLPSVERDARWGVDVYTEAGLVVVTAGGGGCRCGSLGRWQGPTWARREHAR